MAEFQIIEKYFKNLTKGHKTAQDLADDVAKITPKRGEELIISKDIFTENIHFLLNDGAFNIASKLLRTNLSDLASAGARPLHYMLGFGKSDKIDEKFIKEFCDGLSQTQKKFNLTLIGGDTVATQESFFSITIFGSVKKGKNLLRSNAKNGDLIYVSENIGDAHLGLRTKLEKNSQLTKEQKEFFLKRHFLPTPRLKLGQKLIKNNLSKCAIDISDGLFADLNHLCVSSKLSAEIFLDKIPFTLTNLSEEQKLKLCSAGDDYELIFTVDVKNEKKILELSKNLNLKLTKIGSFKKSPTTELKVLNKDHQKIKLTKFGYEHF